jgi:hypothetical protein
VTWVLVDLRRDNGLAWLLISTQLLNIPSAAANIYL